MTGVVLVGLALGGVCAYVWSAIVQAESPNETRVARTPIGARTLSVVKVASVRLRLARERRRTAREDRAADSGPRRVRFDETAALTLPPATLADATPTALEWAGRPSRMLSALQLIVLILLVGGLVAAATLGAAQVVAHAVGSR